MLRLWADEKVARHEMTPTEADQMIRDAGSGAKNWVSPVKDAAGSGKLVYKIARDFAS